MSSSCAQFNSSSLNPVFQIWRRFWYYK